MSYKDEDYFLPLEDQRVFGAGITRKRVPFVRSSELSTLTSAPATPAATGASIANTYLSIVMPKEAASSSTSTTTTAPTSDSPSTATQPAADTADGRSHSAPPPTPSETCEVCHLPLSSSIAADKPHESSLAHQVCLTHSHPPSHLDRTRRGLRYLESYGWDPDSRLGLGATGEGIREPLKGKLKADTVGLGAVLPSPMSGQRKTKDKVQKLNAKQVRKGHLDAKKKGEKLREIFYQDDDVLRYLGAG
ncbi:putative G-patch domain protein [Aspergillus foveolatus]|uniref:putative G-patch domain protein n=1 Tax=Aspergillus foveolatus TaxID=210207 RepID=UPI003CCDDE80